jgi:predicted nucleic acid-binding protein
MILVDSSVWIDLLNNVVTEPVRRLRELIPTTPLLVGDLILCEVLQGFRTDAQARLVERSLMRFEAVSLFDPELAVKAAANYRFLRRRGITIRKTMDLVIGTFCIERSHTLLHSDRDFAPMESLLGLQTA